VGFSYVLADKKGAGYQGKIVGRGGLLDELDISCLCRCYVLRGFSRVLADKKGGTRLVVPPLDGILITNIPITDNSFVFNRGSLEWVRIFKNR